MNVSCWEFNAG
ncbi:hypothetical protein PCS78_07790 [Escherichia coli]|nr:hypothetical protein [Escherichia coli]MBY7217495.1 hypothetical protein [Escherichia ruysiae]MBY7618315.1 hypothetical protein [Escherichia marmotae]MCR1800512.1 hypothetical protein [Escherichia coli O1:HNT]MEB7935266.1 hypothetical protein [Escherichia whittamii]MEB8048351.1 hypothetical protein [Escherichia fergusonii]QWV72055.1 hypothetical protein KQ220_12380 [Escherichia coli O158:H23]QYE47145.1 hypothetical protein KZW90_16630 [Escherichia coli O139:H1]USJ84291.1 hypothetical pro